MSRDWDGPSRVELDAALRSIIHEIGLVGARPGMHTEEVELTLNFTLELDDSGGARPVVHLGTTLPETEVHSVRVTLQPKTLSAGTEAPQPGARSGDATPTEAPAAGGGESPPVPAPAKRRPRRRLKPRPKAAASVGNPLEASPDPPPLGSSVDFGDGDPPTVENARAEAPTAASVVEELLGHDDAAAQGPNWELLEPGGMGGSDLPPSASVGLGGQPAGAVSAPTKDLISGGDFPEDESTDTLDASHILEENEDTET